MPGTAPHRRLIKRGSEALRRHCREGANITGPGDAEKTAVIAAHVRDLGVAPETAKRPIERSQKPGRPILFIRPRCASPLIRGV